MKHLGRKPKIGIVVAGIMLISCILLVFYISLRIPTVRAEIKISNNSSRTLSGMTLRDGNNANLNYAIGKMTPGEMLTIDVRQDFLPADNSILLAIASKQIEVDVVGYLSAGSYAGRILMVIFDDECSDDLRYLIIREPSGFLSRDEAFVYFANPRVMLGK